MMSYFPQIAIIGAGPSGLTLAVLLQRHNIPFTVFDLEPGPIHRDAGGTLDLHPNSGLLALREAGLMEEFNKFSRPEGDALKIVSPSGQVLWDENKVTKPAMDDDNYIRPEIDRGMLRQILLDAVEPDNIRWNKKLQSVEPAGNNTYDLHFTNGTEKSFDLVVGADGAWSHVRATVTDEKPYYSGVTLVDLWALDAKNRHPWLISYVGAGTCFMFDGGRAIIGQQNGSGSVRTYACVQQAESWVKDCGIDWTKPTSATEAIVKRHFADCGEDLQRMVLEARDQVTPRPLYMLPIGITWESKPGVTLIGDAAHLMTPFAGAGVNTAMQDALELAKAIILTKDSLKSSTDSNATHLAEAIVLYESDMFERGKRAAQKTFNQMQDSFKEGGSDIMFNFMKTVRPDIADEATGVK